MALHFDMAQGKGEKFSGGARIAALLAAMAPLILGVYQQSEQARERQTQRQAEQLARVERQAAIDKDIDVATAHALQEQLTGTPSESRAFCGRLFIAATQLSNQAVTVRTRNVLYAALRLRAEDGIRLQVCSCAASEGIKSWLEEVQQLIPADNESGTGLDPLSRAVRSAVAECPSGGREAQALVLLQQMQQMQQSAAVKSERAFAAAALAASLTAAEHGSSPVPLAPAPPVAGSAPAGVPVREAAAPAPAQRCNVQPPHDTRRLRVFIQVPDEDWRERAERLRVAVNNQPPFTAPAIEVVGAERSPRQLEVRYVYAMDELAARSIVDALTSCPGLQGAQLKRLRHMEGRADTGVIEVWAPGETRGEGK